jgi:hypothetical protein
MSQEPLNPLRPDRPVKFVCPVCGYMSSTMAEALAHTGKTKHAWKPAEDAP